MKVLVGKGCVAIQFFGDNDSETVETACIILVGNCGNCGKTLFDRLQKLQNRAARVLTFSSYDADANRLIRQLDWKDLSTQFQIQKSIMVYKSLNGLVPEYLSSKFVKRNETRYSLRDSVNKLFVPFPRTNFMKNSFTYSGAVLWNSLPCHVREAESLSQFKRLVDVHF